MIGKGRRGPRVLFITEEASSMGPAAVLLRLMLWLDAHTDIRMETLSWTGGPSVRDFRQLGRVRVVHRVTALRRLLYGLGFHWVRGKVKGLRIRLWLRKRRTVDLVFLNGAGAAAALRYMANPRPRTIAHIHEADGALIRGLPSTTRALLQTVDRFVVVSDLAAEVLVADLGIHPAAIALHRGAIPQGVNGHRALPSGGDLRNELQLGQDAAVVLAAGATSWRDGADVFIRLAARISRLRPELDVHFAWVNAEALPVPQPLRHDVEACGLGPRFHFLEVDEDVREPIPGASAFVVTAREDVFPVMASDAVAAGVPVVSFSNGGIEALLSQGSGHVVPFLDVAQMADKVVEVLRDGSSADGMLGSKSSDRRGTASVSEGLPLIHDEMVATMLS